MSKICGFTKKAPTRTNQAELQAMLGIMKHDTGAYMECAYFDHGGIGVIRNAAFDRSSPVWSQDRSSCFAYIGDVVDSEDIEHIFRSFEEQGPKALEKINGVFCFAYYSGTKQTLTVGNDRYGFSPLYCYSNQDGFWFASEVKAILKVIDSKEPDWESYADFFYAGHMLGNKTLFKSIHTLESAQILTYDKGSLNGQKYYDFTKTASLKAEDVSTQELASRFVGAVRRRLRDNHPNTLLLSGGFDSRLILGALKSLNVKPKIITLEHSAEREGADGKIALVTANYLGWECDFRRKRPNFYLSTNALDVFYILDGMVPTWELFISEIYQELSSEMGMVWDGLALDVALGGSHQYEGGLKKNIDSLIWKRSPNRKLLKQILTPQYFYALDHNFLSRLWREIDKIPESENRFLYFLLQNRTRRRIAINPYQLFASKIYPVTPATDKAFLDYVLSIPGPLKLKHDLYTALIKEHFSPLTRTPIISGGIVHNLNDRPPKRFLNTTKRSKRLLALKYFHRKTITFTPEELELSRLMIRVIGKQRFNRDFYNKTKLNRLFAHYSSGDRSYHDLFTLVFYIELWHLLFIDEDPTLWNDFSSL